MALKYGEQAAKITLWAKIFLFPTVKTTSDSSWCFRIKLSSEKVDLGCFSEVYDILAGDGARSIRRSWTSPMLEVEFWDMSPKDPMKGGPAGTEPPEGGWLCVRSKILMLFVNGLRPICTWSKQPFNHKQSLETVRWTSYSLRTRFFVWHKNQWNQLRKTNSTLRSINSLITI
jgi:hypothetical protein